MLAHPFWSQPFPPNLLASTAPWCPDNVATTFWSSQLHSQNYGPVEFFTGRKILLFFDSKNWFIWVTWRVDQNLSFTQFKSLSCQKHPTSISSFYIPRFSGLCSLISQTSTAWPWGSKVMEVWMMETISILGEKSHPFHSQVYRFLVDEVDTVWMKGREKDNLGNLIPILDHFMILNNTMGGWCITSLIIISS